MDEHKEYFASSLKYPIVYSFAKKGIENYGYSTEVAIPYNYKMLKDFPFYMHKEMLEAIQLYLPEFEKKTLFAFLKTLIKNYWEIDDSSYFLALNARQRCAVIIWEILQMVDKEEFLLIIKNF